MKKATIKQLKYEDVVVSPYVDGAIKRDDFPGFYEDYLAIHSIIRKYTPTRLMEIGTSSGAGTNIICNAMGIKKGILKSIKKNNNKVYSIDVPPGTDPSIIYPKKEDGHPEKAGMLCTFPYTQIFGSSIKYDFSPHYPIDAWFIDGKHDYEYASKDTIQALKSNPDLIIWHDVQIEGVKKAVIDTMSPHPEYKLYRAGKTRVAFTVKD